MSHCNTKMISEHNLKSQKDYIEELRKRIQGKNFTYHITTYGCQMNVHDSEKLAGMLHEIGYTQTQNQQEADLVLFNTCCVRENAELRVYGNVGALKSYKQVNPNCIIGICGCMMQQAEVADYITKTFPFVDLVFGTHNVHRLPQLLFQALNSNHTVVEIVDSEGTVTEYVPIHRTKGVSAWVTIIYGCNNYCSYCIVPYVRGKERSRQPKDILDEIQVIADEGYKEITLLGQNVNSYGKDLDQEYLFHHLLQDVNKIKGIERIRFMTSHPKDLSDELIKTIAECNKVSKHLHLPIQAGSNRILHEMNRKYTREYYIELVEKIRSHIPDISITTDIIVGFPGETEEDFKDTLELVKMVRFDSAYSFMYSPRKGTPAAKKKDQVPLEEKKERLSRLNELLNRICYEENMKYFNKVVEVLVEGSSKSRKDILTGRTDTNKPVNFKGELDLVGNLVALRITKIQSYSLFGEII
ncbi:MAG: tRNA (N6-isopentenyl adenosine(37)-C2)-methylthiotransferase MiaB [Caldicoprobacterales bacterium]|jgi:tRNA-2-methylthio-N6-dimethylallyladenosine synthase